MQLLNLPEVRRVVGLLRPKFSTDRGSTIRARALLVEESNSRLLSMQKMRLRYSLQIQEAERLEYYRRERGEF